MPENQDPEKSPASEDVLYGKNVVEDDDPEAEVDPPKRNKKVKAPRVDTTMKRDIAFLQKKVADIEIGISEIQDKAQKLDATELDGLKQRLEDVEDLTMVENAGIIELKKMLEASQQPVETKVPEELTARLSAIEEKISAAPQMDTTQIDAVKADLEKLKADVEGKLSEVKSYVPNLDLITNEIRREVSKSSDWMRSELNSQIEEKTLSLEKQIAKMNEKLSTLPSPGEMHATMESISNSFKSFKSLIETKFQTEQNKMERRLAVIEDNVSTSTDLIKSMEEFKTEIDMKKESIKFMVDSLEEKLKGPLPEKALEKLMKTRSDWNINAARLDSLEAMVKTYTKQVESMEPTLKKLESFDKVVDLRNEIAQKFDEVRKMHGSVEKLAKELNSMNVRKERATFESKINVVNTALAEMDERMQVNDNDMSVFQGNLMTFEKNLKDLRELVGKSESMHGAENETPKRINDLEIAVEAMKTPGAINDQIGELISRLVFLESRLGAMETMIRSGHGYSAIIIE
ncbi:MAG: hypothetical protein HYT70_02995 [Candidatus Aenigmarchaeota archaeon]|nr:hypothetical protein [Candidatus Aenigmarchaeota archaeon]